MRGTFSPPLVHPEHRMARTGRPKSNPKLLEVSGAYKKNPDRNPDESTAIKAIVGRPEPSILVQADTLTLSIFNETCDILDSMSILNKSSGGIRKSTSSQCSTEIGIL